MAKNKTKSPTKRKKRSTTKVQPAYTEKRSAIDVYEKVGAPGTCVNRYKRAGLSHAKAVARCKARYKKGGPRIHPGESVVGK